MKLDGKWIVLVAALVALVLVAGCKKKPPAVQPTVERTVSEPTKTEAAPVPKDVEEPEVEPTITEFEQILRESGLVGDVFFDFDSSDLRPDARERLAKNAEFMNSSEGQSLTFVVEGHCDERGTNEYNLALGESRASTAVDYLSSLGVKSSRFRVISYGEERPFCTESTEACWQKNRRARFVLSGR